MGDKFYGHAFTDAGGTGTTFLCHDPDDCKSRLQEKRREFGAAAPEFLAATKQYKVGDRVIVTLAGQDSPASIIGTKVEDQFIRYVVRTDDGRELTVSLGQLRPMHPQTVENNNTAKEDKVKDKQPQTLTEVVRPWKRLTREESSEMRKYSAPRGRLFLPKKDKEGIMSEQPKDMDIRPRTVPSWRRATPEEVEALRARPRHNRLFLPKKKDGTH